MTDITERLREAAQGEELFGFDGMRGDPDPLLTEAADEIDRLRARVDAISDDALSLAYSMIAEASFTRSSPVNDMRAALRAIFNKGE